MKISKEDVRNVAKLARLDIDEASLDKFAAQIGKVLAYVETLNRGDTTDVPVTSHAIPLTNAFREDTVKNDFSRDSALSNAPEKDDGNFIVPRVVG